MNESDVKRIEKELQVKLPASYRHLLLHFPVQFEAGTTDGPLWDDADAIIDSNQRLREARQSMGVDYKPLPKHYLLIGEDGAGWQHLIDLRTDPPIVHVMEFENVDEISHAEDEDDLPQSLNHWYHDYLKDLQEDGVDIDDKAAPEDTMGSVSMTAIVIFAVVIILILVLAVIGAQSLFE